MKKIKAVSLVKAVHKRAGQVSEYSNSHYVFQQGDGELRQHWGAVCYVGFISVSGIVKARLFINQYKVTHKSPKKRKLYNKFIHWIVNDSPWEKAFLNKKDDYFKNGFSMNCAMPHVYVAGAMTAIREAHEFSHTPEVFNTLCKAGVSPELSHMVAGITQVRDSLCVYGRGSGHCLFSSPTQYDLKCYKERILPVLPPMSRASHSYRGIQALFEAKKRDGATFISSILNPHITKKAVGNWGDIMNMLDINNPAVIQALKEIDNG
jgi:hypothetical protein